MRKKLFLLILACLLLFPIVSAKLDITFKSVPVAAGDELEINVKSSDTFYYRVYIYNEINKQVAKIKLDCSKYNKCKSQTIEYQIPENWISGKYRIKVYDYGSPRGWQNFYFDVTAEKSVLTCAKEYKKGWSRTPCDISRCNEGDELIDCETRTVRKTTQYKAVCQKSYQTECLEGQTCKRKYDLLDVEKCGVVCENPDGSACIPECELGKEEKVTRACQPLCRRSCTGWFFWRSCDIPCKPCTIELTQSCDNGKLGKWTSHQYYS